MRAPLLGGLVLALACTHVRPGDMTAAEHRNEAAILQAEAREKKLAVTPADARPMPVSMAHIAAVPEERITSYNPNDSQLVRADADMREAAAHLAAAKKLEAFEAQACSGLTVAERSACPLLASSVAQITHVKLGFQMAMKPGVDVERTNQMLTCHLAYAEKTGFDRPSCPLFVKGSSIRRVGDMIIEFTGETPEVAAELQTQAHRVFRGSSSPMSLR